MTNLLELAKTHNTCIGFKSAGCGTTTIHDLYAQPGTSWSVSFADFISGPTSMSDALGFEPQSAVSDEAAIGLAMQAYVKLSRHLFTEKKTEVTPVAIGVTGAIATNRILRGGNRVYICVISPHYLRFEKLDLPSLEGEASRIFHDQLLHEKIYSMVEESVFTRLVSTEPYEVDKLAEQEMVLRILLRNQPLFLSNGKRKTASNGETYVCGSFNPPHEGHLGLEESWFQKKSGAIFNISFDPPKGHKQSLSIQDVLSRVGMIHAISDSKVEITFEDGLFIDKIKDKGKGSTFLMGADTLDRLLDPKWGVGPVEIVTELRESQCMIAVHDRLDKGTFKTLESVLKERMPETFGWAKDQGVFDRLEGRNDISSTELREQ